MRPAGLIGAVNDFGFQLLRNSRSADSPNTVVSPLAVHSLLSMTSNGASGATKNELRQALGTNTIGDGGNGQWAGLLRALESRESMRTVSLGGALWARLGTEFKPTFVGTDASYYGARLASLDLSSSEATGIVNRWYQDQSRGRISGVLGELPADASLVLTTGSFFQAAWQQPFDPAQTRERPFAVVAEQNVPLPTLASELEVPHVKREGFSAIRLPYASGDCAMYVLLPSSDVSVESLAATIDGQTLRLLAEEFARTKPAKRWVEIPKLDSLCAESLPSALQAMGVSHAFDSRSAQFDPIAAPQPTKSPMRIDAFEAVTRLTLDERGVGGAGRVATSPPESRKDRFVCNRPFLIAIVDEPTQALIVLGEIQDPRLR
jgi:serpin B